MKHTQKIVIAALLAAFTCVATMIIKVPTPTFGYIHLGDGLVLLCGILLGPVLGALAAGIGSMFADVFAGYASFALATLLIKAGTALLAGFLFHKIKKLTKNSTYPAIIIGGMIGECFMVLGYFAYEIFLAVMSSGSFTATTLSAGIAASATGIPFNIVQGVVGILICILLIPILMKVEDIRQWITQ